MNMVSAMLEREYDVSGRLGLAGQLGHIARQLADEYWQDNERDKVALGADAHGNITRIDNILNAIPERIQRIQSQRDNLYAQVEAAKAESSKPFAQEAELEQKSARLADLTAQLDMDHRSRNSQVALYKTKKNSGREAR